jgi:ribosomal protein S12 methylthiotransferase accessory factor
LNSASAAKLAPDDFDAGAVQTLVEQIMRTRSAFGITRVGTITRLDRVGVPVVQVVRPLALSNSVTQGKGACLFQAAASALMESLETWAAERIPKERLWTALAEALGPNVCDLYSGLVGPNEAPNWHRIPLTWLEGWDLFGGAKLPVPAALVDTVYTSPSPHPYAFPRTTTGLGAGSSMLQAVAHAAMEILERHAMAQAHRRPHFFDHWQVDIASVRNGLASKLLKLLGDANLLIGIWRVPASHSLPIYWCHVMEDEARSELVPLPAEGSACGLTHDDALAKALLEACQTRLTAISGAREDITRQAYPQNHNREHLAQWRHRLRMPGAVKLADGSPQIQEDQLKRILAALKLTAAQAAIVVPLFSDDRTGIQVVRVVAPPLRHTPRI